MVAPKALRRLAPDSLRNDPRLRALALAAGVIPPRPMNTGREMAILARLASGARRVVELGVYEGSSAVVLTRALGPGSELHLVDPFLPGGSALRPGWRANPTATRLAVRRATRRSGPRLYWHRARSQDLGDNWAGGTIDLVFIDGDHSVAGCHEDWDVWHRHVSPHGAVAFHDARLSRPDGAGHPGPTEVVDHLFRSRGSAGNDGAAGWAISDEVDSIVVVRRTG
jgi:predicted O-methyltransferase YrrM